MDQLDHTDLRGSFMRYLGDRYTEGDEIVFAWFNYKEEVDTRCDNTNHVEVKTVNVVPHGNNSFSTYVHVENPFMSAFIYNCVTLGDSFLIRTYFPSLKNKKSHFLWCYNPDAYNHLN